MFQTDQSTAVSALPTPAAAATPGFFTNGNPVAGQPATILDADFMNMLMMELINIVDAGGLAPSKTTNNQVLNACKALFSAVAGSATQTFSVAPATQPAHAVQAKQIQNASTIYAPDSGSANAYAVTLSPAPSALVDGMIIAMRAANANTTASTLNVNGLGAIAIDGGVGALQGGEIVFQGDYLFQYNSALPAWRLLAQSGGAVQVGAGLQNSQAVNLAQFASALTGSGYQKLPSGLIIQWGGATSSGAGAQNLNWTYPLAFPNQSLICIAQLGGGNTVATSLASSSPKTLASFNVYAASSGAFISGVAAQFIAIGY